MRATSHSETGDALHVAPRRRTAHRYVALGDSFTAGSDRAESIVRWPDELAARLRAANPSLAHRNLAVPGARSYDVDREQLDPALELRPDIVTIVCGANDVLMSVRPDVERYSATLAAMLGRLREHLPGAAIVTATTPNLARFLDLHDRSRERVAEGMARLAEATRMVARHYQVVCLELAAHPEAAERCNFAGDGYHPSPVGNRRAAAAFCAALRAYFAIAVPEIRPEEAP